MDACEAMSAETVADLRQQHGADKAEEIHPNQECQLQASNAKQHAKARSHNQASRFSLVQDIRVVNGQGSVALELLEQQPDLDAIVAGPPLKLGERDQGATLSSVGLSGVHRGRRPDLRNRHIRCGPSRA